MNARTRRPLDVGTAWDYNPDAASRADWLEKQRKMPIGTPLSPTATRVALPGAGELGKEVIIIALQRLGIELQGPR